MNSDRRESWQMSADEDAQAEARQQAKHRQDEKRERRAGAVFNALSVVGLVLVFFGVLYVLVRFVKWAWVN